MGDEREATRGEVVYLLAELRLDQRGPVHEIGSRARVLSADGDRLTIAVGGGTREHVVTCPRNLVARRRRPLPARPRYVPPDVLPAA